MSAATDTRQRIAVVGGGPMGVALAHELAGRGHDVTLYEADDRLGGLSTWEDFGPFTWDRFYHCVLPTDRDLLSFLRELGLEGELRWRKTSTGVYIDGRSYPLDTGLDFARFSALTLTERARLAWTLVRCFLVRDVRSLEGTTAEEWFVRVGGARPYERIWLPLLRAKFGEAADRVSPVFLVAKVKRMLTARSDVRGAENLGYVSGGYRTVWERAATVLAERGATVALSTRVERIEPGSDSAATVFASDGTSAQFDRVLLTVPFEAARDLTSAWPSPGPVPETARVEYMGLVCLVLAMKREVFPNYVMNIADPGFPFTGVIGMTNLVDSSEVGGYSLAYIPAYVSATDPLLSTPDDAVFERAYAGLARLYPDLTRDDIAHWWVRRAEVVQPVQGIGYSQHAPQPDFSRGPVTVVNNAQLLETDLNNSRVVLHAREAADALEAHAPTPSADKLAFPDPPCVRFVLPAYNEADSIGPLIDRIAETMRGDGHAYRIYVVDDGSSDDTSTVAAERGRSAPVTVLRNEPNQGLGATIARGLRTAAEESGPHDVIVTMDADLTHDPRFTLRMLDRYREGADVVIASRFRHGSLEIGVSKFRLFLTRGARLFYGTLVPVEGVRDYSCGYRLYRSSVIADAFERLGDDFISERGFACMVEILGKLRRSATFAEVPFVLHYEEKLGASTMSIAPTIWAYTRVVRHVWEMDLAGRLGPRPRTPRRAYLLLAAVVILAVLGQTMLKAGVAGLAGASFVDTVTSALLEPLVLGGIATYAVSAALWLAVLAQMNLSVAYPMGAASYVIVVAVAQLLGENVPPQRWAGVAAIVLGIAFIGAGFEMQGSGDRE